jgi:formylglycine-generating enzyme required for sulfatase activity
MQDFFTQQAGFEKVWFFSDDSPAIGGKSTKPTLVNLQRMLRQVFERPFLGDGDNFWFFFSGHGVPHEGRDYLMAADSDPEDVQRYGIATAEISDRLRRCGADNVVMILDACRKGGRKAGEGIGAETAETGKQTGVVSLFSCSPDQFSYEFESIEQGVFTKALLEGLGTQGKCATVERLNLYLERRVPEITREFGVRQNPYTIAEPIEKSHLILLPQYATLADVQTLKLEAFQAESDRLYHKAEQAWIRVLAASPADRQAVEAIKRLARLEVERPLAPNSEGTEPQGTKAGNVAKSQVVKPDRGFSTFNFEYATIAVPSLKITKHPGQAEYFTEDLGGGVTIEMVRIPAGEFMMGSPKGEEGEYDDEKPQHKVKVPEFWMGKFQVTQAQWSTIAKLPKINQDLDPAPAHFKGKNLPVERVSWLDAIEFCDRLAKKTGKAYRLPSEAEWEYACRAGTTTPFHFGETILTDLANYDGNQTYRNGVKGEYREKTIEIGSFPPNSFGLFDMHGNVWEWCADLWHENYQGAPNDGSVWGDRSLKSDELRVLRGGSWCNHPHYCRSALRDRFQAVNRVRNLGFRLLCPPPGSLL